MLVARNYPPLFQLSVYIFIFNKISLLFHLFFLNLGIVCIYPYNLMVTTTCIYWPFFPYNNTYILLNRKLKKRGVVITSLERLWMSSDVTSFSRRSICSCSTDVVLPIHVYGDSQQAIVLAADEKHIFYNWEFSKWLRLLVRFIRDTVTGNFEDRVVYLLFDLCDRMIIDHGSACSSFVWNMWQ